MDAALRNELENLITDMERKLSWAKRKYQSLEAYHPYYLETSIKNGKTYYYRRNKGDTTGVTRMYLGDISSEEVLRIMDVKFLEHTIDILNRNIRLCRQLVRKFRSYDVISLLNSLKKVYRSLPPGRCFRTPDTRNADERRKELLDLKELHPPLYPEKLTIVTDDGTIVRNKAELVIANMLYNLGIPYVYEAPLLVNGVWVHPDFTIILPESGEIYYIEHVGFLEDTGYVEDFGRKMHHYVMGGILPDEQLVLSFEGAGGQDWSSRHLRAKLERLLAGQPAA